jgi:endonuclease-8
MPEGHTIHRAARDQARILVGERLRFTSPQGRFAAGAELLDGRTLTGITPYGKHLWYDVTGILLHVHLGLYGRFTKGRQPSPAPRGALRLRMETGESWVSLSASGSAARISARQATNLASDDGSLLRPLRTEARASVRFDSAVRALPTGIICVQCASTAAV